MNDLEIIDLGTRNGTYVNGKRIASKTLAERDIISIGHALFRLGDGELRRYADQGAMTIADRLTPAQGQPTRWPGSFPRQPGRNCRARGSGSFTCSAWTPR